MRTCNLVEVLGGLRLSLFLLLGAALLLLLQQQFIIAPSHRDVADSTFTLQLSTVLSDGGCTLTRQEHSVSLVVVVPPGEVLVEEAASSWLALKGLEDAIVLHWGSCASATDAAASMLRQATSPTAWAVGTKVKLRQLCVPDEAEWHPGRALNLASSLTSGRLLLIVEPHTWLLPSLLSVLLRQPAIIRRRAAAGLLAMPRSLLEAVRGWDERAAGPSAGTGSVAALHDELLARLQGLRDLRPDLVGGGPPAEAVAVEAVEAVAVAVEEVGPHMAKSVTEAASAPGAVGGQEDGERGLETALGLLAAWHLSRITPSTWRLRRVGGGGVCVAAAVRRPPLARELLRQPVETERAALRERIHATSRGAVAWGAAEP